MNLSFPGDAEAAGLGATLWEVGRSQSRGGRGWRRKGGRKEEGWTGLLGAFP